MVSIKRRSDHDYLKYKHFCERYLWEENEFESEYFGSEDKHFSITTSPIIDHDRRDTRALSHETTQNAHEVYQ